MCSEGKARRTCDGFRGEGTGESHASHDFSVVIYGKRKTRRGN